MMGRRICGQKKQLKCKKYKKEIKIYLLSEKGVQYMNKLSLDLRTTNKNKSRFREDQSKKDNQAKIMLQLK